MKEEGQKMNLFQLFLIIFSVFCLSKDIHNMWTILGVFSLFWYILVEIKKVNRR